MGNIRRKLTIDGSGVNTTPPPAVSTDLNEGFFARASNIGVFDDNKFAVLPEANVSVAYQLTRGIDFAIGYNYLLVTNALQPGSIIDTTTRGDVAGVPSPTPPPNVVRNSDDYWLHGIQFALINQY